MPKHRTRHDPLPAVQISLLHPPIEGDVAQADGGIGLIHLAHPLVVHVERPENTPEGTLFELFWGDSYRPVASNFIREGDENISRVALTVPAGSILDGFANPVFARITGNDGDERETHPLNLRISRLRPGGRDPDPDKDGNQNLIYELPDDVVSEPIDDDRAQSGIEVTFRYWLNMAAYDLLRCVWGSETTEYRVQPDEVGRDIQVLIEPHTIADAGNGTAIPFGFQVIGPTGNHPDEWAQWSAITYLVVDLNSERPEAPYLIFPEAETEIDTALLQGQNVRIGLLISAQYVDDYSLVSLIWRGSDRDGAPVVATPSQDVTGEGIYEFEIDYALVADNVQGRAVVGFTLHGAGVADINSKNLYLSVVGDAEEWTIPTIDEQIGDFLDPNLPGATVRFTARASWPAESLIEVVLVSTRSDDTVEYRSDARPPEESGDTTFPVSGAELRRFDGHLTQVYYILTQPGAEPRESPRREVQVGLPGVDVPKPEVEHAQDGRLNLDDVADYVQVTAPVTDTKFADWLTLYWIGPNAHTSVKVQVVVDGEPTQHPVLRDYAELNLGESAKVFYTLERAGQKTRYSHVTTIDIVQGASLQS